MEDSITRVLLHLRPYRNLTKKPIIPNSSKLTIKIIVNGMEQKKFRESINKDERIKTISAQSHISMMFSFFIAS